MQLLENFKHADTFVQMTLGERIAATMYVIVLGMGITFVALIFIWGLTALMSKIILGIEKKNVAPVKPAPKTTAPAVAAAVIEERADEGELIAVITAAIAASMNTSTHNLVVTNITRVGDGTPVWGRVGRSDVMNSRL